ncbi:MAG: hypothetical protein CMJ32_12200 [Phycisphaerae bacterium]|nr:hypothetical protein [Phycisphaerae bacterium]
MNFFESQDRARRRTGLLVFLFMLAVACIIVLVYLGTTMALLMGGAQSGGGPSFWNPVLAVVVGGGTILVVGIASLVKITQLSGGGQVVAQQLGGKLVNPGSSRADDRRLLNIVEEMAIASGVPVPPVYVMDDDSINAFAAGYSPKDAVIGVTRGCIRQLNRDQLQGVIAHEYSHIFNGDMKLNIRLTGFIFGILVIGLIGRGVLHAMSRSTRRYSRRSKDEGGAQLVILVIALVLMVCGFVGTFFGRLIQAAVSRQREFLADASAVQYTRNPDGIAGALRRIGGFKDNSLSSAAAGQYMHMFFTQAISSLFATHPPLSIRIARIENQPVAFDDVPSMAHADESGIPGSRVISEIAAAGNIDAERIDQAIRIEQSIPEQVKSVAREPFGARALVHAILATGSSTGDEQIRQLRTMTDPAVMHELAKIRPLIQQMPIPLRMAALDMAIPALSMMSPQQWRTFHDNVVRMIRSDQKVELLEWVVRGSLLKNLGARLGGAVDKVKASDTLHALRKPCRSLVGTLAWAGASDEAEARSAYARAVNSLGLDPEIPDQADCTLDGLDESLDKLQQLRFKQRRALLDAATGCVEHDGRVSDVEYLLLRAIADRLDVPIPIPVPGSP